MTAARWAAAAVLYALYAGQLYSSDIVSVFLIPSRLLYLCKTVIEFTREYENELYIIIRPEDFFFLGSNKCADLQYVYLHLENTMSKAIFQLESLVRNSLKESCSKWQMSIESFV